MNPGSGQLWGRRGAQPAGDGERGSTQRNQSEQLWSSEVPFIPGLSCGAAPVFWSRSRAGLCCGNALGVRAEEELRSPWEGTAKEGLFQSVGLVFV